MCLCLGRVAICFRIWFWILFDDIVDETQHRTQMRLSPNLRLLCPSRFSIFVDPMLGEQRRTRMRVFLGD